MPTVDTLAGGACVQTREVQAPIVTSKRQKEKLEEQSFIPGKVFLKKHFAFFNDFDKTYGNISSKRNSC